jgi:hypothetical protein
VVGVLVEVVQRLAVLAEQTNLCQVVETDNTAGAKQTISDGKLHLI